MTIRRFEDLVPKIAPTAYVDETAVVIGDVEIGEDSSIWPTAVLRGDINSIRIGQRTSIQDGTVIHVTHAGTFKPDGFITSVGNDVIVGHGVILHGCTVADFCLIGMRATLLDGVIVEPNVIVGAGSLVTPGKRLESGHLWVGSPARPIRKLTDRELEQIRYSANYYVELKQRHLNNRHTNI